MPGMREVLFQTAEDIQLRTKCRQREVFKVDLLPVDNGFLGDGSDVLILHGPGSSWRIRRQQRRASSTQVFEQAIANSHDHQGADLEWSKLRLVEHAFFTTNEQQCLAYRQILPVDKYRLQTKANISDDDIECPWQRSHSQADKVGSQHRFYIAINNCIHTCSSLLPKYPQFYHRICAHGMPTCSA